MIFSMQTKNTSPIWKALLRKNTIATALGEDPGTIEEVYEPFLIKEGFIKRTPRGREVTPLAYSHLGLNREGSQPSLF